MATLGRWNRTITDAAGNVANATVTVYKESDGLIATIYSDRAGATPKSNPFTLSNSDYGLAFFHAAGGAYKVVAVSGSYSQTWRYEPVGTGAEFDSDSLSGVTPPTTTVPAGIHLAEATNNGSNYVNLTVPAALAANYTFTLPAADVTMSTYAATLLAAASASDARTTLGLGTSATVDTGTSGTKVPLLDGANTWSALQIVTSGGLQAGAGSGGTYNGKLLLTPNDQYPSIGFYSASTGKSQIISDVTVGSFILDAPGGLTVRDTFNGGGVDWLQLTGTSAAFAKPVKVPSYTVATLPSAATVGAGSIAYVTDSNTTTYNATVAGGGANKIGVTSDGTNWKVS